MADAVRTVAGSTLSISAALPATEDAAGYVALTFTLIKEITSIGTIGRVYNQTTHQPIGARRVVKLRGSYDEGTLELAMADIEDPGQALLDAQIADQLDPNYSYELVDKSGAILYFQGLAISSPSTYGTADDVVTKAASIGINSDVVEVAAV